MHPAADLFPGFACKSADGRRTELQGNKTCGPSALEGPCNSETCCVPGMHEPSQVYAPFRPLSFPRWELPRSTSSQGFTNLWNKFKALLSPTSP
jgi:hypothetical protein